MDRIQISDEDLRIIISSLDFRAKKLWRHVRRDDIDENNRQKCQETMDKVSQLCYRLRGIRRSNR